MLTKRSGRTSLLRWSLLLSIGLFWSSTAFGQAVPCKSDKDCKAGEYCATPAFQCRKAICPPTCVTDQDCRFCANSHTRCEPKLKICVTPPTTGLPCQTDAECRQGEICNPSGRCEVGKIRCSRDSDCQPGQVCGSQGTCGPPTPRKCTQDSDCSPGEFCPKGTCYRPPTQCKSDADCSAGLVCASSGYCTPPPRDRCQQSKDCQSNEYCSLKGYCERKVVGCPARCLSDSDCQRCPFQKTSCHPTQRSCVVPTTCKANSDCLAGQLCVSGHCSLQKPLEPLSEPLTEPSREPVKEPLTEPLSEPGREPQRDGGEPNLTEPSREPGIPDTAEPASPDVTLSEPGVDRSGSTDQKADGGSSAPEPSVEKRADDDVSEKKAGEGRGSQGDCACSTAEGMPLSLFVLLLLGWRRRRS